MDQQRMKLENIKSRLLRGEQVKSTRVDHGSYFVQMSNGPEVSFDNRYRPMVDDTIQKAENGVRESTKGNNQPLNM